MMKSFLVFGFLAIGLLSATTAHAGVITFTTPFSASRSNDPLAQGCSTTVNGFAFTVSMLGWNLVKSTCTTANLFPISPYLTAGSSGSGAAAHLWMTPLTTGTLFSFSGLDINIYPGSRAMKNTVTVYLFDSSGKVLSSTQIDPSIKSLNINTVKGVASLQIISTSNRFDVTKLIVSP